MTDPVDHLPLEVIRVLDQKMEKAWAKNNSYPFSYDLTTETIRTVAAQVIAYYQPRSFICRLDLSPNTVGVKARLRITKAPGQPRGREDFSPRHHIYLECQWSEMHDTATMPGIRYGVNRYGMNGRKRADRE
jgi:hypothetical protein